MIRCCRIGSTFDKGKSKQSSINGMGQTPARDFANLIILLYKRCLTVPSGNILFRIDRTRNTNFHPVLA